MTFRTLATAAALFVAASAAQAADVRIPRPYTKGPYVAPVYDWTGFYLGAVFGYATGTSQHIIPASLGPPFGGVTASDPFKVSGATFGGTIGYNYQVSRWVF